MFFLGGGVILGETLQRTGAKSRGITVQHKKKVLICTYKSTAKQLSLGQRGTNFDSDA